ncbi:MAG: DMT family transporter [Methylocystaceae bacterium]|nr:DMT family transporter [Methylocystaceae bacterium]
MNKLLQSPIFLLLATGTFFGFNMPLGKIASDAHISPLLWALVISAGAVLILLPLLVLQNRFEWPKRSMWRYILISSLISFILPNILLFSTMAHVGSGYMGLMYALSPVFTLSLALLFQIKTPGLMGKVGIMFGLIGAVVVSITRGSAPDAPALIWILAALLLPLTLACGNIYRTLDWPKGANPDILAFWCHVFSILFFIVLIVTRNGQLALHSLIQVPQVTVSQLLIAGLTFALLFRLQEKGGPVLLSQIGYVAAAVSLFIATLFLGELYSLITWTGAAIIAVGIIITITAQVREAKRFT